MQEVLYAGLANARQTDILSGDFGLSLADRAALINHPALAFVGGMQAKGSLVVKVPFYPIGSGALQQTADGASVANSAFSVSSASVTIAQQKSAVEISDLAALSGSEGPGIWAQHFAGQYQNRMMELLAVTGSGFTTNTAVDAGATMTLASLQSAISKVAQQLVDNRYGMICLLHPKQWGELQAAFLTVAGALQWDPDVKVKMDAWGLGYKGRLFGCDIFVTDFVPSSGGDRLGCVFGRGGIVMAGADIDKPNSETRLVIGGKVMVEEQRDAAASLTKYVASAYLGASIGLGAAGIVLKSDA